VTAAFVPPEQLRTVASFLKHTHAHVESEIRGASMGTTLPPGSRIRLSCSDDASYQIGEVLVYVQAGRLVAHRMVGRGRGARAHGFLITRGDAAAACDPPVALEQTIGLVTAWRPSEAAPWRCVEPGPSRRGLTGLACRANQAVIAMLLEIHPALAYGGATLAWRVRGLLARLRGAARPAS
jgi:hypothetical protein